MNYSKIEIFTIGHSTRTLEEFIDLLDSALVDTVIDVRAIPMSRTNPQFNKNTLPKSLKRVGIKYYHLSKLGGRRKKSLDVDVQTNNFWRNQSFHNYADYALSEEFHQGLANLLEIAKTHRCAIMCSESVWWRCHRRIIADHLMALGVPVFHLMNLNRIEPAHMTPEAFIKKSKVVTYPTSSP